MVLNIIPYERFSGKVSEDTICTREETFLLAISSSNAILPSYHCPCSFSFHYEALFLFVGYHHILHDHTAKRTQPNVGGLP
jgi:hypothetical protein